MLNKEIYEKIKEYMLDTSHTLMTGEDLLEAIGAEESADKFWQVLLYMEEQGELIKTRYNTYGLPGRMGLVAGRFQLNAKGFGFVIPDNKGANPDVFIPPHCLGSAMNNDRVLARVEKSVHGRKPEGEIIRIIRRANDKVVGVFHQTGPFAFVTPDDRRIGQDVYIPKKCFGGAKDGQKVVAKIEIWPEADRKAQGSIVEVLGNAGDVGLEILSIIKQNNLPLEFPREVMEASRRVPVEIAPQELAGRRDLRKRLIVTVDGEDAKDLDDAIYVEATDDGYLLGVYIADVSYYVREGGALDKEAFNRGTSVYLVDRVLPMLPERLSNGICSLNAGEDRLAMACEMHIDASGKVVSYEIFPGVIRVRYRLSYNIVRGMLAGDEELIAKYQDALPMLKQADVLRSILREKRVNRGAVDFDLPEEKVILDESLHPVEIVKCVHGNAESLIEEFMLAANETVAKHLSDAHFPAVYRVHDTPDEEKLRELARLLATFNVKFTVRKKTRPMDVATAVRAMAGRPEEKLVTTVALRSMRQAVYQTENIGHFGLAAKYYTHFTSPIRRYPDLLIHRLLRSQLTGARLATADKEELTDKLDFAAANASLRERAAADAERLTVKLKMCEYMAERIGEEYDGIISGVTAYGVFVELANGVEGLVHISTMRDDYYEYEEEKYALVGSVKGNCYRLGGAVRIEVLKVDISEMSIDFVMVSDMEEARDFIRRQLTGGASKAKTAAGATAGAKGPVGASYGKKNNAKGAKKNKTQGAGKATKTQGGKKKRKKK